MIASQAFTQEQINSRVVNQSLRAVAGQDTEVPRKGCIEILGEYGTVKFSRVTVERTLELYDQLAATRPNERFFANFERAVVQMGPHAEFRRATDANPELALKAIASVTEQDLALASEKSALRFLLAMALPGGHEAIEQAAFKKLEDFRDRKCDPDAIGNGLLLVQFKIQDRDKVREILSRYPENPAGSDMPGSEIKLVRLPPAPVSGDTTVIEIQPDNYRHETRHFPDLQQSQKRPEEVPAANPKAPGRPDGFAGLILRARELIFGSQ